MQYYQDGYMFNKNTKQVSARAAVQEKQTQLELDRLVPQAFSHQAADFDFGLRESGFFQPLDVIGLVADRVC